MTLSKILKTISVKEWYFLFFVSLSLIIGTTIFLLAGFILTPDDKVFAGTHFSAPNDWFVYYAYIEQTVQGKILFDNLFTHYNQVPLFNILWLSVGLLAKIFNLSSLEAFNVARIILIPVFYVVLYLFLSYLFVDPRKRQILTLMISFVSGMGVFLLDRLVRFPANFDQGAFQWPMDLWVPEANTFLTLYYSPHFIASLTLIVLIFLLSVLYVRNRKTSYSIWSGVLAFILFSFHPFHVPTIFGVLLVYYAALIFRDKKIHWYLVRHYLILFLLAAPAIGYFLYLMRFDFVTSQRALQNMTFTTPLWITFFSYGLLLPLALVGSYFLVKQKKFSNKSLFIVTWAVVQFLLIYLPVNYQRRMTEGLHIPLVILATVGLFMLYAVVKQRNTKLTRLIYNQRILVAMLIGAVMLSSNIFHIAADGFIYSTKQDLAYINKDLYNAMLWLRTTPQGSVVYNSADNIINVIPAYSGRAVFVGHGVETPQSGQKQFEVNWFFSKNRPEANELSYLKNRNISYVLYGPSEKQLGEYDPAQKSYLIKVYSNPSIVIYQVL